MQQFINTIFADGHAAGFVASFAGILFFAAIAYREVRDGYMHGVLYYFVAIFFAAAHFAMILIAKTPFASSTFHPPTDMFSWLNMAAAPALIALFIGLGSFRMAINQWRLGLIRVFFGLTLLCYLYMLGSAWPLDVKGFIAAGYIIAWFEVETAAA